MYPRDAQHRSHQERRQFTISYWGRISRTRDVTYQGSWLQSLEKLRGLYGDLQRGVLLGRCVVKSHAFHKRTSEERSLTHLLHSGRPPGYSSSILGFRLHGKKSGLLHIFRDTFQRRQWHPPPVLLPGKSHGWRSLVGCSPWGR